MLIICLVQGAALVNIYKDGSLLVTHGGTEMGQGINTKAIQVEFMVPNFHSPSGVGL